MESEEKERIHHNVRFPSSKTDSVVVLKQSGRWGPKNLESLVGDILCSRWLWIFQVLSQGDGRTSKQRFCRQLLYRMGSRMISWDKRCWFMSHLWNQEILWFFSLEYSSFSQSCLFPQLTESIHCLEHHPFSPRGFTLLLYYEYQEKYDHDTKWPRVTFGSTLCCSWVVTLSKKRRHWDNGPASWWAGHRVCHPTLRGSA